MIILYYGKKGNKKDLIYLVMVEIQNKIKGKKENKKDMLVNVMNKSVKELLLQKLKDYKKEKQQKT